MAFQNITMNLSALNNIPPLNITIITTLGGLINTVDDVVDGKTIISSMFIIGIVCYLALSDKTLLGDFNYDDARALSITLGICLLLSFTLISISWSSNFIFVGMMTMLWLISLVIIIIYSGKE